MEGYQATFSSLYSTNQTLNGSFDGGNTTCGTGNGADSNTIIVSITSTYQVTILYRCILQGLIISALSIGAFIGALLAGCKCVIIQWKLRYGSFQIKSIIAEGILIIQVEK